MAEREDKRRRVPLEGSPTDIGEVPGWSGRLMVWLRVAAQLAAIQLMMVAGTLLGLVIVGLGPALASGATLLRRIVDGDPSDALWRDFWRGYREELRRASLVTAPFLAVIVVAWYEALVLLAHGQGPLAAVLTGAVVAVGAYAVACLAYAPHVLRRYDDGPGRTLRFVALSPLLSPLTAVGTVVTAVAIAAIGLRFPPAFLLVGLSIPVLLGGLIVDRWLDKVDARTAQA
ncbi:YesL family protein [Demequina lignilytica]|uniref:DUF624 domain-containing protein n=1 Tax=Demequina lignilytica TaxID=3051663 RepID=A0AAW7M8J6_9MICO|nr:MULTISPECIES: DUF624 domain-containing protein [unclassified Demequina]MDN4479221.1 DUF624 domain-containing protein [Demequina sp. SYSU T00039-1]MDN4484447.1 DUF624 domain-containing protein [Demequina sp. SYSU T0a273]MDN4487920.1 DUF624 domain-containing protein [Demequina sp. SYSU T00039]MDN4491726.1 DUF624 domain-containing protein [Demequina sp. SYSU T00068]